MTGSQLSLKVAQCVHRSCLMSCQRTGSGFYNELKQTIQQNKTMDVLLSWGRSLCRRTWMQFLMFSLLGFSSSILEANFKARPYILLARACLYENISTCAATGARKQEVTRCSKRAVAKKTFFRGNFTLKWLTGINVYRCEFDFLSSQRPHLGVRELRPLLHLPERVREHTGDVADRVFGAAGFLLCVIRLHRRRSCADGADGAGTVMRAGGWWRRRRQQQLVGESAALPAQGV